MKRPAALFWIPCLLIASCAAPPPAQPESDWERAQKEKYWNEVPLELPAYPKAAHLIGFEVSAATDFKFFVDSASLSVGKDGVVRYALVVRSPSGVDNVSYEGIHCRDGTYKVYAFGQSNGTWRANPVARWRPVEPKSVMRWHEVLRREYFCPQNIPIASAAAGIAALRRGGNVDSRGYMPVN